MTKLLEEARNSLKLGETAKHNVGYAIVGEHSISTRRGAYCFGKMTIPSVTLSSMSNYLGDDGVVRLNDDNDYGGRIVSDDSKFLILRLRNDRENYFCEPKGGVELENFLRIQEEWLTYWEKFLVEETFEERRERGVVVDLERITANELGIFLVGSRNLYEQKRYQTIHQLMSQGWSFQEAFTLSYWFRYCPVTGVSMYDAKAPYWTYPQNGHVIVDELVERYSSPKTISTALRDNFFFKPRTGAAFSGAKAQFWCNGQEFRHLIGGSENTRWPYKELRGLGLCAGVYGFHIGEQYPELEQFRNILKEVK